jgi:plastocyanin
MGDGLPAIYLFGSICLFMRVFVLTLAMLGLACPVLATTLTVTVKTPSGQPVKDAVVTLPAQVSRAQASHDPVRFDWPLRMSQHEKQFDPFVLIAPVGADVAFPNLDKLRHHVYSFSAAKTFELKLYSHDESRLVHFDKPGTVALGCNIHDTMIGFVRVVDTPYAAKTNAQGVAVLEHVEAGRTTLSVWQPYLKGRDNQTSTAIVVPAQAEASETVTADVRPPPPPMVMP